MPSRLRRSSSATDCSPSGAPATARPGGSPPHAPAGGSRRAAGFSLLEVLVALAILGLGLGVVFRGIGQGLRLRGESADNVRLSLVAERVLGGLVERETAPEVPEEGEDSGCRWRLETVDAATAKGAATAGVAAQDRRGAPLAAVRITVTAPSGRGWELTTLLPREGGAQP